MKTIEVHVTDADIRHGIRGSGNNCPIARATRRALAEATGDPDPYVEVNMVKVDFVIELHPESSDIRDDLHPGCFDLTEKASEFVWRFDAGEPVGPLSLRFRLGDDDDDEDEC